MLFRSISNVKCWHTKIKLSSF